MPPPEFQPGFRLSTRDQIVLVVGALCALLAWPRLWWGGLAIAFAVGHFFLFCNVFRIARRLELVWTVVFLLLVRFSGVTGRPSWGVSALLSLSVTAVVVIIEMRKPSYHGIGWARVNPGLRAWWDSAQKR